MEIVKADCPCPKQKCERHGNCIACESYHVRKRQLPFCKRDKYLKRNEITLK